MQIKYDNPLISKMKKSNLDLIKIIVPNYSVGQIKGKGGNNIRSIMQENGVDIHIYNELVLVLKILVDSDCFSLDLFKILSKSFSILPKFHRSRNRYSR